MDLFWLVTLTTVDMHMLAAGHVLGTLQAVDAMYVLLLVRYKESNNVAHSIDEDVLHCGQRHLQRKVQEGGLLV